MLQKFITPFKNHPAATTIAAVFAVAANWLEERLAALFEHAVNGWILERTLPWFANREAIMIASVLSYLPGIITSAIVFIAVFWIGTHAHRSRATGTSTPQPLPESLATSPPSQGSTKSPPPTSTQASQSQLVLSTFRAQLIHRAAVHQTVLNVTFSAENSGASPLQAIKVEGNLGIGFPPTFPDGHPELARLANFPIFTGKSVSFPDDLAPGRRADWVVEAPITDQQLSSTLTNPFIAVANGTTASKCGNADLVVPFDYWLVCKPGEQLPTPTPMLRVPPFLRRR